MFTDNMLLLMEERPVQNRTSVHFQPDAGRLPKPYFAYATMDNGLWWKLDIFENATDRSQWLARKQVGDGLLLGRAGRNHDVNHCFYLNESGWYHIALPAYEAFEQFRKGTAPAMSVWNKTELQMALLLYPDADAPAALKKLAQECVTEI